MYREHEQNGNIAGSPQHGNKKATKENDPVDIYRSLEYRSRVYRGGVFELF